jgi:hypothetical protein
MRRASGPISRLVRGAASSVVASCRVNPLFAFALVGVVPALGVLRLDRRVMLKRLRANAQATRTAIADEVAILKSLEAGSPAALQLNAVVEQRLNGYLGLTIQRPKLIRPLLFAVLCATCTALVGLEFARSNSTLDHVVYAAGMGFFATMSVGVFISVFRVMRRYRSRSVSGQGEVLPEASTEPEVEEVAPEHG